MAQYKDLFQVAAVVTTRRTHLIVAFLLWLAGTSVSMQEQQQHGMNITGMSSGCVGASSIIINQKKLRVMDDYGDSVWGVNITNYCNCNALGIHLHCGSFRPNTIDPASLLVLGYDDCLINGGHHLSPLQTISFEYERLNPYPLSFRSAYFEC